MKALTIRHFAFSLLIGFLLTSCLKEEDPGPLQLEEKDIVVMDFDRLDMEDAFVIDVRKIPTYSIHVRGDRRNLDDLSVIKTGSTLKVNYKRSGEHNHTTYISIGMPVLNGGSFAGASNFAITGFTDSDQLELSLSGASTGQVDIKSRNAQVTLSGASVLSASGLATSLVVRATGASEFQAFAMEAEEVNAMAAGASVIKVFASKTLKATAGGASTIYYRGAPSVTSSVSGASIIRPD